MAKANTVSELVLSGAIPANLVVSVTSQKQGNLTTSPSNHLKQEISAAERGSENMQTAPLTGTKAKAVEPESAKLPIPEPTCENNKSCESSEGLAANLHHDRTSEQFIAQDDNFVANSNPRNKSTFSKQLGS